ncbi:hypothetical protein HDE_09016 [Halotydeus destructor]|nr:hypothetical protein HDE_09016 [Halotydeus destructor]
MQTYVRQNNGGNRLKAELGCTKVIKDVYLACYCFFVKGSPKYDRSPLANYGLNGHRVFAKRFNEKLSNITRFSIHLHSSQLNFYGRQNGELRFDRDERNEMFPAAHISYRKTTSRLLKAPYTTQCLDYMLPQAESVGHCLEKCFTAKVVARYNRYPRVFSVFAEDRWKDYKPLTAKSENKSQLEEMVRYCSKACGHEACYTEHFEPIQVGTLEFDLLAFALYLPGQPALLVTALPQTELIDYIILILSCVSFWFGFSPYGSRVSFYFVSRLGKLGSKKTQRPLVKPNRVPQQPYQRKIPVNFRP